MQLNKLENIIFLKDLESNLIEEAFVVLKKNVNLSETKEKKKSLKSTDILNEAEMLLNSEINKNDLNLEKFKFDRIKKKYKFLKVINIILIIILIIVLIFK